MAHDELHLCGNPSHNGRRQRRRRDDDDGGDEDEVAAAQDRHKIWKQKFNLKAVEKNEASRTGRRAALCHVLVWPT